MDVPDRFATGVALLWATVAVVIVTVTFALTARRDPAPSSTPTATIVAASPTAASTPTAGATPTAGPSRPSGVPGDAALILEDTSLAANPPGAPRLFFWLTCDGPLLTIATTLETIYAEVDCSRYWLVHEVVRPYQGQPVRIDITTGPNATLVIEAEVAGAARFEVGAVWVAGR